MIEGRQTVRIEGSRLRATVNPGTAVIQARMDRTRATARILTTPIYSDRSGDGTPDFLRLDDLKPTVKPLSTPLRTWPRRNTSASLSSYRQRLPIVPRSFDMLIAKHLREHDANGRNSAHTTRSHAGSALEILLSVHAARRKAVPQPAGTVSRVRTFRIVVLGVRGRGIAAAIQYVFHFSQYKASPAWRLLFYRQPDQRSPAHAMIFMAATRWNRATRTGWSITPVLLGRDKGEIRRPTLQELLNHPQPQWRPVTGNSNFLGVYRWNI